MSEFHISKEDQQQQQLVAGGLFVRLIIAVNWRYHQIVNIKIALNSSKTRSAWATIEIDAIETHAQSATIRSTHSAMTICCDWFHVVSLLYIRSHSKIRRDYELADIRPFFDYFGSTCARPNRKKEKDLSRINVMTYLSMRKICTLLLCLPSDKSGVCVVLSATIFQPMGTTIFSGIRAKVLISAYNGMEN